MKTQIQMYYEARRKIADQNAIMMEMLYGPNPITDDELIALIKKRPQYQRFSGYVGKRKIVQLHNLKIVLEND